MLFCSGSSTRTLALDIYIEQLQILVLRELSYQSKITLDNKCLQELKWWRELNIVQRETTSHQPKYVSNVTVKGDNKLRLGENTGNKGEMVVNCPRRGWE